MGRDAGFWCCLCAHICRGPVCCLFHNEECEWMTGEELTRFVSLGTQRPLAYWEAQAAAKERG